MSDPIDPAEILLVAQIFIDRLTALFECGVRQSGVCESLHELSCDESQTEEFRHQMRELELSFYQERWNECSEHWQQARPAAIKLLAAARQWGTGCGTIIKLLHDIPEGSWIPQSTEWIFQELPFTEANKIKLEAEIRLATSQPPNDAPAHEQTTEPKPTTTSSNTTHTDEDNPVWELAKILERLAGDLHGRGEIVLSLQGALLHHFQETTDGKFDWTVDHVRNPERWRRGIVDQATTWLLKNGRGQDAGFVRSSINDLLKDADRVEKIPPTFEEVDGYERGDNSEQMEANVQLIGSMILLARTLRERVAQWQLDATNNATSTVDPPAISESEQKVLEQLDKSTILLKGPDASAGLGERAGKESLARLEKLGLIHRPKGKRSGYTLTEKGKQFTSQKRTKGAP